MCTFFFYFPIKVDGGHSLSSRAKTPAPGSYWQPCAFHFRLIQVLKNSMAWHFLTFTSPSSKLEFAGSISPCCRVEEQMLIFLLSLTPGRVNPISKLTVVLIWIRPLRISNLVRSVTVLKKICHKENSESEQRTIPNFLVFLFELFVAKCIHVNSGAVYSG